MGIYSVFAIANLKFVEKTVLTHQLITWDDKQTCTKLIWYDDLLFGDLSLLFGDLSLLFGDLSLLFGDLSLLFGDLFCRNWDFRSRTEALIPRKSWSLYVVVFDWKRRRNFEESECANEGPRLFYGDWHPISDKLCNVSDMPFTFTQCRIQFCPPISTKAFNQSTCNIKQFIKV